MKTPICLLLVALILVLSVISATAATAAPLITLQPQSPCYPEYSVAVYTVKATGSNLTATWYLQWEGSVLTPDCLNTLNGDLTSCM